MLVQFFADKLHLGRRAEVRAAVLARKRQIGADVRTLEPTPRMTEAEKEERYRTGRFAEMTEKQAGL